ncbi:MAG: hypothetical protein ACREUE_17085 [Panacagrimonas sp.]
MRKIAIFLAATAALVGSVSAHAGSSVQPLPLLSNLNLNLGRVVASLPLLSSLTSGLPALGGALSGTLTAPKGGLGSLPALDGLPALGGKLSAGTLPGLGGGL